MVLRRAGGVLAAWCLVGCDGIHPLLFPSTPSVPENFRERLFLTNNAASDLLTDATPDLERDVSALAATVPESGLATLAAQEFLMLERELAAFRSGTVPLPPAIPVFPSADEKRLALADIAQRVDVSAVSPLAALTEPDRAPLFVRRERGWVPSAETVQVWMKAPSPYIARVIDTEARAATDLAATLGGEAAFADYESASVANPSFSLATFYARSLFEPRSVQQGGVQVSLAGEAFQMAVQCARLRFGEAGAERRVVWPRLVIFEAGTGSDVVVRHTLVRNELMWDPDSGDIQAIATPTLSEVVRRSVASLYVHATRRSPDRARSGKSFWYARESSTRFFSRFGALLANPTEARQIFASYQAGVSGLVLEASPRILVDGSIPVLSTAQTEWLAGEGDPSRKDRGPDDAWVAGIALNRVAKGDWRHDADFRRNGIHSVDWSSAASHLPRSHEAPAAFSGAFPFSQQGDIEAFCVQSASLWEPTRDAP